jgi:hypothetical protein
VAEPIRTGVIEIQVHEADARMVDPGGGQQFLVRVDADDLHTEPTQSRGHLPHAASEIEHALPRRQGQARAPAQLRPQRAVEQVQHAAETRRGRARCAAGAGRAR